MVALNPGQKALELETDNRGPMSHATGGPHLRSVVCPTVVKALNTTNMLKHQ